MKSIKYICVVLTNAELRDMNTHELMPHLLQKDELQCMFPNLVKLGLLLPMSTVDGFQNERKVTYAIILAAKCSVIC